MLPLSDRALALLFGLPDNSAKDPPAHHDKDDDDDRFEEPLSRTGDYGVLDLMDEFRDK